MAVTRTFTIRSLAAALVAIMLLSPAPVLAQTQGSAGSNLTMTPSSTELAIDPGNYTENRFELINGGETSYDVYATALPYHVQGLDYDAQFTQLPGTTNASQWVKYTTPTKLTLGAKKSIGFDYTVQVPANAQPGGYYAVLFASATPQKKPGSGVVTTNRVGNILYITVNGPVKRDGTVKAAPLAGFTLKDSMQLGVIVENTGGIHYKSLVQMSVKNVFGREMFRSELTRLVLPQTSRQITDTWSGMPPVGIYKVQSTATVAGEQRQAPGKWVVAIRPWVLILALIIIAAATALYLTKRKTLRKTK